MIAPLRFALIGLSIALAFVFGQTAEKCLLEVIRYFVFVDMGNALFFNAVYLVCAAVPVLVFGLIVSVSVNDDEDLKRRMWAVVWGIVLSLTAFRIYQVWWVMRGGGDADFSAWSESVTESDLFFREKVYPYIMLGLCAGIVCILRERNVVYLPVECLLSGVAAFWWLYFTGKLQNLNGMKEAVLPCMVTASAGLFLGLMGKQLRTFIKGPE